MKKLAIVMLAVMMLLFAGCNTAPIEWKASDDLGNGLFALLPEIDEAEHEWYCVADAAPAEAECKVGGKKTNCEVTSGERESGGVLFYTLSTEEFHLDSTKKIKITQKFENKTVTIEIIPQKVKAAFDNEK